MIGEIAEALGVSVTEPDVPVTSVITDSREAEEGALFVALRGERTDGHLFINEALASGAAFAIAEEEGDYHPAERVLRVPSSLSALLETAAAYRARRSATVVGITGSVGKTTTKDMVAAVFESSFQTVRTEGNQNNGIGVPKTLFRLAEDTEFAVVEMGMSAKGEIRDLCRAAKPGMGIITNIGVSHIGSLGSREDILEAKLELASALPDGAPLVLCSDDRLLRSVSRPNLRVIRYGLYHEADVKGEIIASSPDETVFGVRSGGRELIASIPGIGEHLVENALAAFAAGQAVGVPMEKAVKALSAYRPTGMRQRIVRHGGLVLVEDCYNASPDSMRAAVRTLKEYPHPGRKLFVAGDMLELGDLSETSHRELGALLAESGADALFTVGEASRRTADEALKKGLRPVFSSGSNAELLKALLDFCRPGDMIWFKGSRGMALEEVVESLKSRF